MSLGDWIYYRKKYKLVINSFKKNKKTILVLTYERNWELPAGWNAQYFDISSPLKIINTPEVVLEREFNDGKTEYQYLYDHGLKGISPKVFWFIDAHVANTERIKYCNNFDFVFVAQSPYINYVKKHTSCKNIFWLPLCYFRSVASITENTASVKYPISFIGRYGNGYKKRTEIIKFLQQEYKEKFFAATDYVNPKSSIQQSKITINQSLNNDLNFRVFEALGYGTELVTDYVDDLDKIEGLKERLNWFCDKESLKQNIDLLLADEFSKKHNMVEVQQWIKQNHTMKNRLTEMLEMIDTGKQVEYK